MKQAYGWSLLELLVVTSIVALMCVSATSGFGNLIQRSKSQHAAEQTLQALVFARQLAISQSSRITLCGINTNQEQVNISCQKTNINAWVIFNDLNANYQPDSDGTNNNISNEILRLIPVSQEGNHWLLKLSFGKNYLRFSPEGNAMEAGSIIYCHLKKQVVTESLLKVLKVNYTGRAYLVQNTDLSDYIKLC